MFPHPISEGCKTLMHYTQRLLSRDDLQSRVEWDAVSPTREPRLEFSDMHSTHVAARSRSGVGSIPPGSCIDAVSMLFEGGQGSWRVQVPQLDGVIPAACQESVSPDHIPVDTIHLHCRVEALRKWIGVL